MMTLGVNKIIPVYDNGKPIERRINNLVIAGWENKTLSGESLEFEGTYNGSAAVLLTGKSGQATSNSGKNLWDPLRLTIYGTGEAYLTNGIGRTKLSNYPRWVITGLQPNTGYRASIYGRKTTVIADSLTLGVSVTDFTVIGSALQWYGKAFTSSASGTLNLQIRNMTNEAYIDFEAELFQLELGTVRTDYEAFIPVSPMPGYPSAIASAGNCNLNISDQAGIRQTVPDVPVLRKVGEIADSYDPVSGEHVQRIYEKVFNGTENFILVGNTGSLYRYSYLSPNIKPSGTTAETGFVMCSHFPERTFADIVNRTMPGIGISDSFEQLDFVVEGITAILDFKAWLAAELAAGRPVTVLFQLDDPATVNLGAAAIASYLFCTQLETDGSLKPDITAVLKTAL